MSGIPIGNKIITVYDNDCHIHTVEYFYKHIFPYKKAFVPTEFGWDFITDITIRKKEPCYKIWFSNGALLSCSVNQCFMKADNVNMALVKPSEGRRIRTVSTVNFFSSKNDYDRSAIIGILDCDEVSIDKISSDVYICVLETFFYEKIQYAEQKLKNNNITFTESKKGNAYILKWFVNFDYVWNQYSKLNYKGYLEGVLNISGDAVHIKNDNIKITIKTKKSKVVQRCFYAFLTFGIRPRVKVIHSWYGRYYELYGFNDSLNNFLLEIDLRWDLKEKLFLLSERKVDDEFFSRIYMKNIQPMTADIVYDIRLDKMKTFLVGIDGFVSVSNCK